jgi:hypothetical protein
MNVPHRREGFVNDGNDAKVIDGEAVRKEDVEPRKHRSSPPPEIEPSPAEKVQEEALEWPMTVTLINKPIRNNRGEKVTEITLREPRAGDINRYGNPVRFTNDGEPVYDERKMTYMIAALSDILVPFIEEMHPRDWNTVALKLRNFFLPDPRGW